jgi:HD-GYP domain-containing protein (c-di-GMP phosphodiesterase class II)
MGLDPEQVERIRTGALLHDIGKIGIADSVLQKPGRLTDEEFAIVKEHPVIGRRILEGVRGLAPYLDARIIHVSDAYDAMTSNRSYRRRMTHDEAIHELFRCAGTQFDPRVVELFAQLPREIFTDQPRPLEARDQPAGIETVEA